MASHSCSSFHPLPTRLLQLCPLRSAFITLQPLSSVLHTAAHLIKDLRPRDHFTPTLKQLHWIPIHACIAFKISLLMCHVHSGTSPSYMLCFQFQRTPIIHAWGHCCNSHKSEV